VKYDFLVLSLLFCVPGLVVFAVRRDLRRPIGLAAAASLPFAATERFFYPTYWSPRFAFDLIDVVGFGIEDVLFVVALAAYMTTAYPFVARRRFVAPELPAGDARRRGPGPRLARRALAVVGATLAAALGLLAAGVPILYASFYSMAAAAIVMLVVRRDLLVPALAGGALSTVTYAVICLIYARIFPGVFERVWHTERFLHRFVLGVPIEELLYGLLSGVVSGAFYPFVTGARLAPLSPDRGGAGAAPP
jgi:hypothetical protein